MTDQILSHARLLQVLHYDSDTGIFRFKERPRSEFLSDYEWKRTNRRLLTFAPGSKPTRGKIYGRIRIDDRLSPAHRLAWFYVYGSWPDGDIDHINHDPMDNRIINLRCVTAQANAQNQKLFINSTSRVTGISRSFGSRWRAYIVVGYKQIHLGCFGTFEAAVSARKAAELKYGFHPNHGKNLINSGNGHA